MYGHVYMQLSPPQTVNQAQSSPSHPPLHHWLFSAHRVFRRVGRDVTTGYDKARANVLDPLKYQHTPACKRVGSAISSASSNVRRTTYCSRPSSHISEDRSS
jgi:hypothetical protein